MYMTNQGIPRTREKVKRSRFKTHICKDTQTEKIENRKIERSKDHKAVTGLKPLEINKLLK